MGEGLHWTWESWAQQFQGGCSGKSKGIQGRREYRLLDDCGCCTGPNEAIISVHLLTYGSREGWPLGQ